MKNILYTVICLLLFGLITRCDSIHESPDENGINPTLVSVNLDYFFKDTDIGIHTHSKKSGLATPNFFNTHLLRYTVEIYTGNSASPLHRYVYTSEQLKNGEIVLNLNLQAAKYTVLTWVDYVDKTEKCDLHYDTNCLKNLRVKTPYNGNYHTKDAFAAKHVLDLTSYGNNFFTEINNTIELERALSSFMIVATDMKEYVDEKNSMAITNCLPEKVEFDYHPSLLVEYDISGENSCVFSDQESFNGDISDHTDESCVIAYDYVLMNEETSNIEVSFNIYDSNNEIINRVKNLKIPLKRNACTMVYLSCLIPKDGQGGIGIDDAFDDEIEIIIP